MRLSKHRRTLQLPIPTRYSDGYKRLQMVGRAELDGYKKGGGSPGPQTLNRHGAGRTQTPNFRTSENGSFGISATRVPKSHHALGFQ